MYHPVPFFLSVKISFFYLWFYFQIFSIGYHYYYYFSFSLYLYFLHCVRLGFFSIHFFSFFFLFWLLCHWRFSCPPIVIAVARWYGEEESKASHQKTTKKQKTPRKKERKKKNPPNQRSWRHIDLCHLGYATQIDTGYLCCFFRFYFQGDSGRWSRWRAAKKVSHTFLSKKKKMLMLYQHRTGQGQLF